MVLRIANAQAFWGDDSSAAARVVAQSPDVDWLTLDYLAEVSMSILAKQRQRDPASGYAKDFLDVIRSLVPAWRSGRRVRVVTNAGGLNPLGCAQACVDLLRRENVHGLKVGVVSGDDVLPLLREKPAEFTHLEDGTSLGQASVELVTANAYLGAAPLVQAINAGADIIITGRVADPSLTVAPAMAHFRWAPTNYDAIAGATVAGHLIECGTQVTGGISTDWLSLPRLDDIGFPIVEIGENGFCEVTKPQNTGGRVSTQTVKEQLLYELGDPANYLSPDATVSFLTLKVENKGRDRVYVSGATGGPPPETYKVSATYRAGFRASGTLVVVGRDAREKARKCGEVVRERLRREQAEPRQYLVELIGEGAVSPIRGMGGMPMVGEGNTGEPPVPRIGELVLRISVADPRREVVEMFTRAMMPLISAGPQGITGYAEGRPVVREVFGYWPTLIPRSQVTPRVQVLEAT